ncbi:hypothetical protein DDZ13_14445 [Coraliomargarita sinensis]|uniref:Uncharacterized protein n=2 Tax=Coraliomargarita sinensis TaxID=2174842 RepID=A0A317ZFM5_9BACT|nr:hypothetical protein DDZ13_14445 [Coraliomargarita sinensis]
MRGGVASELSIKESDLNSRIRTIDQNLKNSKNLEQDTEDLKVVVDKMNSLLFDRYERAINISFFYEFEDKADVVISNISQLPAPDPIYAEKGPRKLDLHSTLVYNITLSGSFSNVLRFFYELDRAEPLIRVADFQVSRNKLEEVDARLRVLVMAEKD